MRKEEGGREGGAARVREMCKIKFGEESS